MFSTLARGVTTLVSAAGCAVVATGAFAQAPSSSSSSATSTQQAITQQEVQAYIDQVRKDAEAMMKPVNPDKIMEWTKRNIIDDAVFLTSVSMTSGDVHKGSINLALTKREILAMGGLFAQSSEVSDAIEGYSLTANVGKVVSHGADAATVHVTWKETITVDASKAGQHAHGGAAGAASSASATSSSSTAARAAAHAFGTDTTEASTTADTTQASTADTTQASTGNAPRQATHQQMQNGKLSMDATADCWHLLVRNGDSFAFGLSACTGVANL